MLDGTDNRDPILGIIVINPTLESVTEAKMTSQNYDAEFGQAIAGVVPARPSREPIRCTAAYSASAAAMRPRHAIRSARVRARRIPSLAGRFLPFFMVSTELPSAAR